MTDIATTDGARHTLKNYERLVRKQVEQNLSENGFDGTKINEITTLNARASLRESHQDICDRTHEMIAAAQNEFKILSSGRQELIAKQRQAFDNVIDTIESQFNGHIRATRINSGRTQVLKDFISQLRTSGITRWWNGLDGKKKPSPADLLQKFKDDHLDELEMSQPVQKTFRSALTEAKQRELAALRCPDHYILELRVDENNYRPLKKLSGGQRVSILLSLLLETSDERPLVIDQPEDELDNRFLFDNLHQH